MRARLFLAASLALCDTLGYDKHRIGEDCHIARTFNTLHAIRRIDCRAMAWDDVNTLIMKFDRF